MFSFRNPNPTRRQEAAKKGFRLIHPGFSSLFLPVFAASCLRVGCWFALLLPLFSAAVEAREAKLTILFTNDHHGQVDPSEKGDPVGGVSRRMALIERIRLEEGASNVLLVDSGDLFTGTALSDLTRGEVDCAAYQLMKYDAIVLGETDFNYGKAAILDYRRRFGIPWISANVVSHSQPFLQPYKLKYAGGLGVGFIGLSHPDTPNLTRRDNVAGLLFNPPGASAKGLFSIFKKQADFFVVLSHLGLEQDKKFASDNGFVHVVIGGHSHDLLKEPLRAKLKDGSPGALIVQAGSRGLYLGRLDLRVKGRRDPKTKLANYVIMDHQYRAIPVDRSLPEDPAMSALLGKYHEKMGNKPLDEPLAEVSGDLLKAAEGDSLMGRLACDAMRKASGAEAALLHNGAFQGGFRSGIFTRGGLHETYPFDDEVVVLELPGSVLRKVLETSAGRKGAAGFLQVSGIEAAMEGAALSVKVAGSPLEEKRTYLVAVNDFLAQGGQGYTWLRKARSRRKTQVMLRELLEKELLSLKKVAFSDFQRRWRLP